MTKQRLFKFLGEVAVIIGAVTAISFPVAAFSWLFSNQWNRPVYAKNIEVI